MHGNRNVTVSVKVDEYERDVLRQIAEYKDTTVSAVAKGFILDGLRRLRHHYKNTLEFTPPPPLEPPDLLTSLPPFRVLVHSSHPRSPFRKRRKRIES